MPPSPQHDHTTLVVVTEEVIETIETPGVTDPKRRPKVVAFPKNVVATASSVAHARGRGLEVKTRSLPEVGSYRPGDIAIEASLVGEVADGDSAVRATQSDTLTVADGDGQIVAPNPSTGGANAAATSGNVSGGEPAGIVFDPSQFGDDEAALRAFAKANSIPVPDSGDAQAIRSAIEADPRIAPSANVEGTGLDGAASDGTVVPEGKPDQGGARAGRKAKVNDDPANAEEDAAEEGDAPEEVVFDPAEHGNIDSLRDFAKAHDIDLGGATKRDDIEAAIQTDPRVVAPKEA